VYERFTEDPGVKAALEKKIVDEGGDLSSGTLELMFRSSWRAFSEEERRGGVDRADRHSPAEVIAEAVRFVQAHPPFCPF